jgi:hypothetical protein
MVKNTMKKKHSNAGREGKTTFAKSSPYGTAESLTYVFPSLPESLLVLSVYCYQSIKGYSEMLK